jgi:hypothetical protein
MTTALAGQADLNSIEEASLRTRRAALRRLGLRRGLFQSEYSLTPESRRINKWPSIAVTNGTL